MVDTHNSALTGGSGYWGQAATWDKGAAPAAGDSVVITSGDTVYYDIAIANQVSIAALTVTGTLRFVTADTPANGAVQSTNPATRVGLGLMMADAASITGAGALYVGNSTTDYIARPTAAATYVPNVTITLGTTGTVTVTTQRYYGWVPTTPSAHPAYTTITGRGAADANPPLATDTTIRVADSDFDVLLGEKIVVGVGGTAGVMAEANKGLYTCNAVPSSSVITISTAGGLVTNRVLGDYVSVYSRPILITKPTYNAATNAVASGVLQGVRINQMRWTTGAGWTCNGLTFEGNNNAAYFVGTGAGAAIYTDCVISYVSNSSFTAGAPNEVYTNCCMINSNYGLLQNASNSLLRGCVAQNCSNGFINGTSGNCTGGITLINCTGRANTLGGLMLGGANTTLVNCTGILNHATYGDMDVPYSARLYNCTLATTPMAYNYGSANRPTWATLQSYDHGGVTNARHFWGRGGYGGTDTTLGTANPYNGANTMEFVIETANTPLIWDQPFELPANRQLSFIVPMARNDATITTEVWVYAVTNDPLWTDPLRTHTPLTGTTQGTASATYVVGYVSVTPTAGTEGSCVFTPAIINIPPSSKKRDLVARIIVMGSTTGKHAYVYLDAMEAQLLKKRTVYL